MAKKKRVMKKQVRRTLGALFLASSIVVAAIPTGSYSGGEAQADPATLTIGTNTKYKIGATGNTGVTIDTKIPHVQETYTRNGNTYNTPIYTTGDGWYQFAYVDEYGNPSATNRSAIILGFSHNGSIENNTLTIPDTVDGYKQYDDNQGSSGGYCAVGQSGNYLFYCITDTTWDGSTFDENPNGDYMRIGGFYEPVYDDDGNRIHDMTESDDGKLYVKHMVTSYSYYPCYYDTYSTWNQFLSDPASFYYYPTSNFKPAADGSVAPVATSDQAFQWIHNVTVIWIGNQYLTSSTDGTTGSTSWEIAGDITDANGANQGIFANHGNIGTLITGRNLSSIGDYAFYGCTGLTNFNFGNGLNEIGNHAFDACTRMSGVSIPDVCSLKTIGAYAFKDCRSMSNFSLPNSVETICDGAFQNGWSLQTCDLTGGNNTGSVLTRLGYYAFWDCMELSDITFPQGFTEGVEMSAFAGCNALNWISTGNTTIDFYDSTEAYTDGSLTTANHSGVTFTWDDFKEQVTEKFYFEGKDRSANSLGALHQTCTANELSYKYYGEDRYERTTKCGATAADTVTFQVDSTNTLLSAVFNSNNITTLDFPNWIGPYYIGSIAARTFQDHCTLETLTLPANIQSIGDEAFKGCHNLRLVRFENPSVSIGNEAFKTQDVSIHVSPATANCASMTNTDNSPKVALSFVGEISDSSTPYLYAMNANGNYNNRNQATSFITYYSGWPTCLTVKYVYDGGTGTGYPELQDFPTNSTLSNYATAFYLTADQQAAAANAIANATSGTLTEEQQIFLNAAKTLTIPSGVDAIKDGLFKTKVTTTADAMDVVIEGLTKVETGYTVDASGDAADGTHTHHQANIGSDGTTFGYHSGDTGKYWIDMTIDPDTSDFAGCSYLKTVTFRGTETVDLDAGAFFGCTDLTDVSGTGAIGSMGDRAFGNCTSLATVSLQNASQLGYHAFENDAALNSATFSSSVSEMSVAPFWGCSNLAHVDFGANTNFTCENSIIYGNNKATIIEVLAGRASRNIRSTDVTGVTALSREAFGNTPLTNVDLSGSSIASVPEFCFKDAVDLSSVILPASNNSIKDYAFDGTKKLVDLEIYNGNTIFSTHALDHMESTGFDGTTEQSDHTRNSVVEVYAPKDSQTYAYADANGYTVSQLPATFTVVFWDYTDASPDNMVMVDSQTVIEGRDAVPPTVHGRSGYFFIQWWDSQRNMGYENVHSDLNLFAQYSEDTVTVNFYNYDGTLLSTETVARGSDLTKLAPEPPEREGYTFTGWDRPINAVATDLDTYATYSEIGIVTYTVSYYNFDGSSLYYTAIVEKGKDAPNINGPARDGYTFTGWDQDLTNVQSDISTIALYKEGNAICTVTYYTYDGLYVFKTYEVEYGGDAPYIMGPERKGYVFTGWDQILTNVTQDIDTYAQYVEEDVVTHTVNYYTFDGATLYYTIKVIDGENAPDIQGPEREGYTFTGWDRPLTNIKNDMDTVAQYVSNTDYNGDFTVNYYTYDGLSLYYSATVGAGEDAPFIQGPAREGYTFTGWDRPLTNVTASFDTRAVYTKGGGGDGGGGDDDGGDGDTKKKYYTLTVINGSGSGSYVEGAQVIIVADDPASGKVFDSWSVAPEATKIASKVLSATVITMPGENCTVTASFKNGSNGGNGGGGGGSNSGNGGGGGGNGGNNGGNSGTNTRGGTTVVIDKNGLSNTGVVSATVNGSSDNFTIKITESSSAAQAALTALMAEYGDISNIVYFPMDISLYDAAGTTKITDTTGLSITITLPIPDSMIQYAGNNKIACIIDNQLSVLAPKFTTINGVACMTFTATHFSPYVIYVNTNSIVAGGDIDTSPKTADGIHPKWFFSIGLFAISLVLFLKRDRRTLQPVKADK